MDPPQPAANRPGSAACVCGVKGSLSGAVCALDHTSGIKRHVSQTPFLWRSSRADALCSRERDVPLSTQGEDHVRRPISACLRATSLLLGLFWLTPLHAEGASTPQSEPDLKAACATGFEQSQVLRQSGKLRASRSELLKCVQSICSRAVQEQCSRWLEDVERFTPSIVVQATADGQDRSDVQVELDGEVLTHNLSGSALDVDPGAHAIRFVCADYPPIQKNFVLREGEKLRTISVAFEKPQVGGKKDNNTSLPPEPVTPVMHRPVPALAYALGGVALLGGGAFAYLGLTAQDRRTQLENQCSPNCVASDVNPVHQRLIAADVSLGIGVAALAAAAIVYVTRPSVPEKESAFSSNVSVTANAIAASASLKF